MEVAKEGGRSGFGSRVGKLILSGIVAVSARGLSSPQPVEASGAIVQPMSAEMNPSPLDLTSEITEIKSDPTVGNVEKVLSSILDNPNYIRSLFPKKPIESITVRVSDANGNVLRDKVTKNGGVNTFSPSGEVKSAATDCSLIVEWPQAPVTLPEGDQSQADLAFLNKLFKTNMFQPGARMYVYADQSWSDTLGDGTINYVDQLFMTDDPNPDDRQNSVKLRRSTQGVNNFNTVAPEPLSPTGGQSTDLTTAAVSFEAELGINSSTTDATDLAPTSPDQAERYKQVFQDIETAYKNSPTS